MAKQTILLVEDNPLTRKMMRYALLGGGYEVVDAGEGLEALRLAEASRPDLVVQDYVLPDMDGLRFLEGLRALPGAATLPVLVVTGMVSQLDSLRQQATSATTFLPKPIEPSRLVDIVRSHLAGVASDRGGGRRVLVVDDEPLNLKLAALRIREAGFEVQSASGGQDALKKALDVPPDAILSDVLMPGMDGFRLCDAVRREPRLARVPVILLSSAFVEPDDARLAREMGASALLPRTADFHDVVEALVDVLRTPLPAPASRGENGAALHQERVQAQLEKQLARNEALVQQGAIQAAALSVVRGLAEAMARPRELPSMLAGILVHCLDCAGLSTGLLYLLGPDGLRLQAQAGLPAEARSAAANCFGHFEAVQQTLATGEPAAWGAHASGPAAAALRDLATRLGQTSTLVIPFVVADERLGALLLASAAQDLSEPAWTGFARTLAAQFGQTIALGRFLSRGAESETRYRSLMENANDAILLLDPNLVIVEANQHAELLLGRPRNEIVGSHYPDLVVPEERGDATARQARFLTEGRGRAENRHLLRGDGTPIVVDVSSALVELAHEKLVLTIIRDVTERHRAEEALRAAQERMRHLVSSSPTVIYAMKVEGERLVPAWLSPNLERLLGYTPEEALAPEWWVDRLHPDDDARPLTEGASLLVDGHLVDERRFRHRDGTYRWLRDEGLLLRQTSGEPSEVVGSWSDVSRQKEAELRLRQSEEEYRLLFDRHPHPMSIFDLETMAFLDVNQAAVLQYGYSREELLRMSPVDLRSPEAVPAFLERLEESLGPWEAAAPHVAAEWKHRRKNGTELTVETSVSPILFRGRRVWLTLVRDITEKKRLEAQFLQAQKMEAVGQLAGGVAHDFNNLLGVITGYAELLAADLGLEHKGLRRLEQIRKAAHRAAGLTRQLLAFSRKQVLDPKVLDLNAVLTEIEKMLRRLIGEDILLVTVLDEKLGSVLADPGQLEQVIVNLAVNARDAMPQGGRLVLETANVDLDEPYRHGHPEAKTGPHVMLAASDNGHGMAAETMARIFEPFFTTKPEGKGTGLGLSTVFGIVSQSGGHVTVDSEVGRGTSFKVYLPRVAEGAKPASAVGPPEAPPRGTETVLVVEDAEALRSMVGEVLAAAGYEVLEAGSPEGALEIAASRSGPIDLLLTDVVMPGMGGRELSEAMRRLRPGLPVVYMSGYTDEAISHHGDLEPGTHFVGKPFSSVVLLRKLRSVLDGVKSGPSQAGAAPEGRRPRKRRRPSS